MIICEVGLNHMGSVQYANEYIDKIIKSRADGVLFHIREDVFYKNKKNSKLLLPEIFYYDICKKLHKHKIKFGITLANPEKIDFCEKVGVDFYKIFSRDINDVDIFNAINKTKKKTFISTGLSDISEINKIYSKIKNQKKRFTLIHTQLNNDIKLVNLKTIPIIKKKFQMNVAYGNHSKNIMAIYLALAFEPSDLIFYVKGKKRIKHIDENHAVQLEKLPSMLSDFRELPYSLGSGTKIKMTNSIF